MSKKNFIVTNFERIVSEQTAGLQERCKEAIVQNNKEAVVECLALCKDFLKVHGDYDLSVDVLHLSTRPRKALRDVVFTLSISLLSIKQQQI